MLVAHNIMVAVVIAVVVVVIMVAMVGLSDAWVMAFPVDRPGVHLELRVVNLLMMMLNNTVRGVVMWVLFKCHMLHSLVVRSNWVMVDFMTEVAREVRMVNHLVLLLVKRESLVVTVADLHFVMLHTVRSLGLNLVEQLIVFAFDVVHDLLATMVVNIVLIVVSIVVRVLTCLVMRLSVKRVMRVMVVTRQVVTIQMVSLNVVSIIVVFIRVMSFDVVSI